MATPLRVASGGARYIKSLPKSRRQYGTAPMPDFIEPQLAKLVGEPPRGAEWVHEIKFDGPHTGARSAQPMCPQKSECLRLQHQFPEITQACAELPDCIIDGEVCAVDAEGMPSFAQLQRALSDGRTNKLVFFVFDLLWLKGDDKRPYDLETRKEQLGNILSELDIDRIRYVEHITSSGAQMFASACKMKLEGIVSKNGIGHIVPTAAAVGRTSNAVLGKRQSSAVGK